jgi:hypothetical protein
LKPGAIAALLRRTARATGSVWRRVDLEAIALIAAVPIVPVRAAARLISVSKTSANSSPWN